MGYISDLSDMAAVVRALQRDLEKNWLVLLQQKLSASTLPSSNPTSELHQRTSELAWNGVKLTADLLNHGQSSLAHTLHRHGAEPIGKHSTHQEAGKHLHAREETIMRVMNRQKDSRRNSRIIEKGACNTPALMGQNIRCTLQGVHTQIPVCTHV